MIEKGGTRTAFFVCQPHKNTKSLLFSKEALS